MESTGMTPVLPDKPRRDPNSVSRPSWRRWTLAALLILGVVGFYAVGLHRYLSWEYVRDHVDYLQRQVHDNLGLAAFLFFLVYVAVTALSLPAATVLTLLAGAFFGRWMGTAVVSLASTLGACLAFLSSRFVLRDWVERRFGDRLGPLQEGVERDGAYYLFTLRLVPLVPFFLINLAMGLTRMRLRSYAWVSLLGMLPATFLYVNAGTALAAIDTPRDALSPGVLISLALLGAAPLGFRWLLRFLRGA